MAATTQVPLLVWSIFLTLQHFYTFLKSLQHLQITSVKAACLQHPLRILYPENRQIHDASPFFKVGPRPESASRCPCRAAVFTKILAIVPLQRLPVTF